MKGVRLFLLPPSFFRRSFGSNTYLHKAIEVRTPSAGVKAQWVRIELRKVETLPGGGDANKFYDYVGPSPVTLWTAPDEYNILRTVSFQTGSLLIYVVVDKAFNSKTFLSQYEYQNQYRPLSPLRIAVSISALL